MGFSFSHSFKKDSTSAVGPKIPLSFVFFRTKYFAKWIVAVGRPMERKSILKLMTKLLSKSDEDMRQHMKYHFKNKCTKCKFVSESENELKLHDQSHHKEILVDIGNIKLDPDQPATFSCEKCDYKCTLNIALKKHEKKNHG